MFTTNRVRMCTVLCCCFLMLTAVVAAEETEVPTRKADDHFALIVDFAVDRDPVLAAQEEVIAAARALDERKPRDLQIPDYAQASLLEVELQSALKMQEAQQVYAQLKKELVSAISRDITELLGLKNQIRFQDELQKLLQDRMASVERQVQAGLVEPGALWELSEKIIDVQTNIADARDRTSVLRREIAFNYGGDEWRQMLNLIEELEKLEQL